MFVLNMEIWRYPVGCLNVYKGKRPEQSHYDETWPKHIGANCLYAIFSRFLSAIAQITSPPHLGKLVLFFNAKNDVLEKPSCYIDTFHILTVREMDCCNIIYLLMFLRIYKLSYVIQYTAKEKHRLHYLLSLYQGSFLCMRIYVPH